MTEEQFITVNVIQKDSLNNSLFKSSKWKMLIVWSGRRLEPPFLPGANPNWSEPDRSCPQHWLSLMLSFMWLNFRPCISICLTILYMELITVHVSFNLACSTLTNLFCFAWWGLACFAWWGLACYVLAWNILWPDFCHGKLSQLHVQQLPAYEGFLPSNGHHCEFVNSLNA